MLWQAAIWPALTAQVSSRPPEQVSWAESSDQQQAAIGKKLEGVDSDLGGFWDK